MEQISNPNVDAVTFLKTSLEKQGLTGVEVVPNGDRWDIKLGEKTYTLAATGSILDWSKTLANATKHEDQSSTNPDIGIDMYGNPVNLDLWNYEINESEKTFATGKNQGSKRSVGYIGEITSDGKVIGEIPQYIKINSNVYTLVNISNIFTDRTELTVAPNIPNTVTNMCYAFYGCKSLIEAPKIPNSVTNMSSTFEDCTLLTQAPIIPNSVTDMCHTFDGCTSLTQAPAIPNSVTDMGNTFYGCTSLTQAPAIPNSVTNMDNTFRGCTSLTQAPVIPNFVRSMTRTFESCTSLTQAPVISNSVTNMQSTFSGCTSLTQAPEIPNTVTDMICTFNGCTSLSGTLIINASNVWHGYSNCLTGAATNEGTNLVVTGSCPQLDAIIATKSANSHITKGN